MSYPPALTSSFSLPHHESIACKIQVFIPHITDKESSEVTWSYLDGSPVMTAATLTSLTAVAQESAVAQKLRRPLSDGPGACVPAGAKVYVVLRNDTQQVLALGKFGYKDLWMPYELLALCEYPGAAAAVAKAGRNRGLLPWPSAPCLLDLCVHSEWRRHGLASRLLSAMAQAEGIPMEQVAIDRPSEDMKALWSGRFHRQLHLAPNNFAISQASIDQEP